MKSFRSKLVSLIPDKVYLQYQYFKHFGRFINFKSPKRFTEKIQWLKIYNRNNLYTKLVDKYTVREYIANKIGDKYLIPLLGVWDTPNEIDFNQLPNQFVLKTTHDSGGVFVCRDKSQINESNVRNWLAERLSLNVYPVTREWPYKDVKPRIICEKFMSNDYNEDLVDYKWYCFNGEPTYCQVIMDRHSSETIDFFDVRWNHLDFIGMNPNAVHSNKNISKPHNLELMISIARKLAHNMPFVRVDLYEINQNEYFGELTFFPNSGFGIIRPKEWDKVLGDLIQLPAEHGGGYKILINKEIQVHAHNEGLKDYKFFCFGGTPQFLKVDYNRFTNHKANYYDLNWNLLDIGEEICPPDLEHIEYKPLNFDKMVSIVNTLCKDFPFIRVDLYNCNGQIYFGEMTFFPASGFGKFLTDYQDIEIGKYLVLDI